MKTMKAKLIKANGHYYLEQIPSKSISGAVLEAMMGSTDGEGYHKISKQNCDEIFGVVDVEELAYNHRRTYQDSFEGMNECIMKDAMHQQVGFIAGFNKAMELNATKTFTLEEMMMCWNTALKFKQTKVTLGEFIHSLQPTEIEVEIEMEDVIQLKTRARYITNMSKPKLDADGCLILKKIENEDN